MRIEGTCTVPATIDRVFAPLVSPDVLKEAIPGCRRLIQLGPSTARGDLTFEARVESEAGGPATLTLKTTTTRPPEHVQLEISGYADGERISGQALIDLVDLAEQGDHTLGAYVLTLASPEVSPAAWQGIIEEFCARLSEHLYADRMEQDAAAGFVASTPAGRVAESAMVRSPRPEGQVIPLSSRWSFRSLDAESARSWRQRALWMGTGMLIGGLILTIAATLVRWLGDHEDS